MTKQNDESEVSMQASRTVLTKYVMGTLSRRDEFAKAAMQAFISRSGGSNTDTNAAISRQMADDLIAELDKKKPDIEEIAEK